MVEIQQIKRTVYAVGETVLDLVSDDGVAFRAVPGGSVLNASVSLGRMGATVQLVSEFGNDDAGRRIDSFLKSNGVQTQSCTRYPDHKTSLALAFLDESRKASYSFYHDSPVSLTHADLPYFRKEDILLFGSYYAVKPGRRDIVLKILKQAVEARSVIYYDLNIRKAHLAELDLLMPSFFNNIAVATIVKGSDEDFYQLFGLSDAEAIYERVRNYCKILLVTNGSGPVQVVTPSHSKTYPVQQIQPVSTIGAGDNFNAGFIYGLSTSCILGEDMTELPVAALDRLVGCGLAFATEACMSEENYISGNFEGAFWEKYI
jgi:fructokinase